MPLTFSLPPGIPAYFSAKNPLKSLTAFLSSFFTEPVFSLRNILTRNNEKPSPAATCSIIGSGDLCFRKLAADLPYKMAGNSNLDFDVNTYQSFAGPMRNPGRRNYTVN